MPAIGDPPAPVDRQERTVHGAIAPASYVPLPAKAGPDAGGSRRARAGGRRPEETRRCQLCAGAIPNAAGSAHIEQGQTKVLATVFGPRQAGERAQKDNATEGALMVDIQFAPFCSRVSGREENEKRALMYCSVLKRALESVVLLERYAKTAIDVSLLVLEDDGAVLTAALAAASLALADAQVEMHDLAFGATVHLVGSGEEKGTLLLDCDGEEERSLPAGSAVLHVGLCPARGTICMLHSIGPLSEGPFEQMVLLAREAAKASGAEMRRCLERRADRHAAKRARLEADAAAGHGAPEEAAA